MTDEVAAKILTELAEIRARLDALGLGSRVLDKKAVARMLGCDARTVWRHRRAGLLAPGERVGKSRRWTIAEAEACLERVRSGA